MIKLDIKPLSVNSCWRGRRFKTDEYKRYEIKVKRLLPDIAISDKTDLRIVIEWGLSSLLSDVDNPAKPFIDILQKKFDFNDRYVQELNLKKVKVKGDEYIKFKIIEL